MNLVCCACVDWRTYVLEAGWRARRTEESGQAARAAAVRGPDEAESARETEWRLPATGNSKGIRLLASRLKCLDSGSLYVYWKLFACKNIWIFNGNGNVWNFCKRQNICENQLTRNSVYWHSLRYWCLSVLKLKKMILKIKLSCLLPAAHVKLRPLVMAASVVFTLVHSLFSCWSGSLWYAKKLHTAFTLWKYLSLPCNNHITWLLSLADVCCGQMGGN